MRMKYFFADLFKSLTFSALFCISFFLFFHNFEPSNFYKRAIGDDKIKTKLAQLSQHCGVDHFWTWIVINEAKKEFYFQDVIGCNKANPENCAFSIKNLRLNPFYLKTHKFTDDESFKFLSDLNTGAAGYYDDISFFSQYKTISDALASSNKKLESVGLAVTKFRNNLVYLFIKTSSVKNPTSCQKNEATNLLEELSIYAEGNL